MYTCVKILYIWGLSRKYPAMYMHNRDINWRYKIQETLYIGQWCISPPQSRLLGTSHSSPSVSSTVQNTLHNSLLVLPLAALSYFPRFHWQSEISSFSKVILVLGRARSHRAPNLGYRGAESPGWLVFQKKNSAQDMIHEQVCCHNEAADHQLPTTVAVFIVLHLSTNEEHWGNVPYWSFGLEGHTCDVQHRPNQKTQLHWSWSCCNFAMPSSGLENQVTSIGMTGPLFPDHNHRTTFISGYDLLEEIWFIGSGLNQVISNCSTMLLLL